MAINENQSLRNFSHVWKPVLSLRHFFQQKKVSLKAQLHSLSSFL